MFFFLFCLHGGDVALCGGLLTPDEFICEGHRVGGRGVFLLLRGSIFSSVHLLFRLVFLWKRQVSRQIMTAFLFFFTPTDFRDRIFSFGGIRWETVS